MPTFDLTLLVPLLAAHFLSDFVFQTDAIVRNKTERPQILLLHLAITGLCAYLLIGDFHEWRIPVLITATHGLIDLLKIRLTPRRIKELPAFIGDQAAHLLVIFAISAFDWKSAGVLAPWWENHNPASYLKTLAFITGIIATTQWSGILIAKALPKMLETDRLALQADTGFQKAGRYIGYLERILLLIFVLSGQLAAAGFLIAAKSVLRFQKANEDRKQTEYILLGTLFSFTLGIAIAYATQSLLPK